MGTLKTMSRPVATSGNALVPAIPRDTLPVEYKEEGSEQQASVALPTGQNINVVTNHNIHLPFKEWMLRGVVGGIGSVFAFPFRLIGDAITSIVQGIIGGIIGIVKLAIIVILLPTLAWLGIVLMGEMQEQESVEEGSAALVDHAGDFITGVSNGVDKGLNKEAPSQ